MGSMLILAVLVGPGSDLFPKPVVVALCLALLSFLLGQLWLLWRRGQTVGKILLGIRIVRVDTLEKGGFVTNVLLRTLLNNLIVSIPIAGLLYGLADALFIFRDDRRCLHDKIAGTCVVVAP